jgi:hypothetical protein
MLVMKTMRLHQHDYDHGAKDNYDQDPVDYYAAAPDTDTLEAYPSMLNVSCANLNLNL